ncbi:uncharacterized protein RB166_006747 [Leptodactylus fuscus]
MDEIHLIQSWSRYNNKVQALHQSLGLPSWRTSEPTFHKSGSPKPDDTSRKIFQSGQRHMTGSQLQREVLKHCGPSAFHAMMESYSEDPVSPSPPMQKVIDKVLIRRSMDQAHRRKHREEAIRNLEAAGEHLRKELKNLEAQNEFFGNGWKSQVGVPLSMKLSTDLRNRNEKASPAGTDLLEGLAMDDYFLDEVVKEILSPNLSPQPQKMTSEELRQRLEQDTNFSGNNQWQKTMTLMPRFGILPCGPENEEESKRRRLEATKDHALLLIEEEIILEVTSDITKQVASDVFKRAMLSNEFDSHFESEKVQEYLKSTNPLHF